MTAGAAGGQGQRMGDAMTATITTRSVPGQEHWTQSNGKKLFMAEKRSVSGPPKATILLVHGSSMGSQGFDLQIPGDPDASIPDFLACRRPAISRLYPLGSGFRSRPAAPPAAREQG